MPLKMTKKWSLNKSQQLMVLIMLSVLTQLFSSPAKAGGKTELSPRKIDLSGNVFHFSMPEDFSKDMPASDMVESLDISDPQKFDDREHGNLIRRWWDIKESGWFGKELGTVMVDISVQRVVENRQHRIHDKPYNLNDRLDFMLMLDDRYHQRYDELNAETGVTDEGALPYFSSFATMLGETIRASQREHVFSHQKWIQASIAAPRSNSIITLALPITEHVYLDASFTYSPNDNVRARDFLEVAFAKMRTIQESFRMQYAEGNPFAEIVGGEWLEQTNNEVLEQHRDKVLKLFYYPESGANSLEENRKTTPKG